jgi:hypothetical protein
MINIRTLAQQFGVSESDLESFAQSIVLDMKKDSVDDAAKLMTDAEKVDVVQAYAAASIKKTQRFVNSYIANPEAADAFRRTVRNLL